MTRISELKNEKEIALLTSTELMKLHRQHIRDRRVRKGSIICGQILSATSDNSIIEFYPGSDDIAM